MAKVDSEKVKQTHFKAQLEHIVAVLNSINEGDPTVLPALIGYRVPCNQVLADHPTVQVGKTKYGYEVGLLGILTGIKEDGYGYIAARFSDTELVSGSVFLKRIERFELLEDTDGAT